MTGDEYSIEIVQEKDDGYLLKCNKYQNCKVSRKIRKE
jgi:hypothetical protein